MSSEQLAALGGREPPWDALGRDTEAGRKLFLLYGGQELSRHAGVAFSTRNRRRISVAQAAGRTAPPPAPARPPPPPKPKVAVPRVGLGTAGQQQAPSPQQLPRRRPGAAILSELRAAADEEARAAPPPPRRPLLGDAEKARCALLMQHNGKLPAAAPAAGRRGRDDDSACDGSSGSSSSIDPAVAALQARFDMLAAEVAEREAWAADMAAGGLLTPAHEGVLRGEVAARAAEMRRLDAQLRALEAAGF